MKDMSQARKSVAKRVFRVISTKKDAPVDASSLVFHVLERAQAESLAAIFATWAPW